MATNNINITAQKRQRNGIRMNGEKAMTNAGEMLEPETDTSIETLNSILGKLTDYRNILSVLDNNILVSFDDDDDAGDAEAAKASEVDDKLLDCITKITSRIDIMQATAINESLVQQSQSASRNSLAERREISVKLPKLNIMKFHGNPLNWQEFWDSYETTIHNNGGISDIDKFKYLRSFLGGDAMQLVEGYRLTSANYAAAVENLAERFGNKQAAIFSHFEAMLAIPAANHETHQLQLVYDNCEKHIRSLEALGLPEDTFGQVFTPIILSKLPVYVKVELHRKNGPNAWTLSTLREFLKEEIRARDMSQRSFGSCSANQDRRTSNRPADSDRGKDSRTRYRRFDAQQGTSSSLLTNASDSKLNCSFCKQSHFTDQCTKYKDVQSRTQQMKGRCFSCLSTKHVLKDCPYQKPCYHCKKMGHHRSLCWAKFGSQRSTQSKSATSLTVGESNNDAQKVNTSLLSQGERVMLQTALTKVQGTNPCHIPARLLFDTGCSRSFITSKLSRQIGARPKGEESIAIAGFEARERQTKIFKIVEFDIVLSSGQRQTITANVTSNISAPVQKYPIDVNKCQIIHQLMLAEPLCSSQELVEIDVLVGTDYYYDIVGTERIKCENGTIFLSSSLGFIATGRVECTSTNEDNNLSTLLCPQFAVEKYWSLEDIGIKSPDSTSSDEDALKSFNESVKFEDKRYQVCWPWNGEAGDLPENRSLACGRLKSLMNKISVNKILLQKYDDIIQDQIQKVIVEDAPSVPSSERVHYIPHLCVETPQKNNNKGANCVRRLCETKEE